MKFSAVSSNRKVLGTSVGFEDSESDGESNVVLEINENELEANSASSLLLKDEGCTLAESGDFQGALNSWHKALQLDPTNYVLYELRAQVYLELEMYLPAMQSAEKAIEINPNWGVGYHTLARCQREAGEVCLSLKNYQTAAQLLPNDVDITAELDEVTSLSSQLHQLRLERYQALQQCDKNSPAHEANSCIYHLSARATGLIDPKPDEESKEVQQK